MHIVTSLFKTEKENSPTSDWQLDSWIKDLNRIFIQAIEKNTALSKKDLDRVEQLSAFVPSFKKEHSSLEESEVEMKWLAYLLGHSDYFKPEKKGESFHIVLQEEMLKQSPTAFWEALKPLLAMKKYPVTFQIKGKLYTRFLMQVFSESQNSCPLEELTKTTACSLRDNSTKTLTQAECRRAFGSLTSPTSKLSATDFEFICNRMLEAPEQWRPSSALEEYHLLQYFRQHYNHYESLEAYIKARENIAALEVLELDPSFLKLPEKQFKKSVKTILDDIQAIKSDFAQEKEKRKLGYIELLKRLEYLNESEARKLINPEAAELIIDDSSLRDQIPDSAAKENFLKLAHFYKRVGKRSAGVAYLAFVRIQSAGTLLTYPRAIFEKLYSQGPQALVQAYKVLIEGQQTTINADIYHTFFAYLFERNSTGWKKEIPSIECTAKTLEHATRWLRGNCYPKMTWKEENELLSFLDYTHADEVWKKQVEESLSKRAPYLNKSDLKNISWDALTELLGQYKQAGHTCFFVEGDIFFINQIEDLRSDAHTPSILAQDSYCTVPGIDSVIKTKLYLLRLLKLSDVPGSQNKPILLQSITISAPELQKFSFTQLQLLANLLPPQDALQTSISEAITNSTVVALDSIELRKPSNSRHRKGIYNAFPSNQQSFTWRDAPTPPSRQEALSQKTKALSPFPDEKYPQAQHFLIRGSDNLWSRRHMEAFIIHGRIDSTAYTTKARFDFGVSPFISYREYWDAEWICLLTAEGINSKRSTLTGQQIDNLYNAIFGDGKLEDISGVIPTDILAEPAMTEAARNLREQANLIKQQNHQKYISKLENQLPSLQKGTSSSPPPPPEKPWGWLDTAFTITWAASIAFAYSKGWFKYAKDSAEAAQLLIGYTVVVVVIKRGVDEAVDKIKELWAQASPNKKRLITTSAIVTSLAGAGLYAWSRSK